MTIAAESYPRRPRINVAFETLETWIIMPRSVTEVIERRLMDRGISPDHPVGIEMATGTNRRVGGMAGGACFYVLICLVGVSIRRQSPGGGRMI